MLNGKLTIAFVRRGYSPSGGAEAYLKRLAQGIVDLGHEAQLVATDDWPANEWSFGSVMRVNATSAIGFANELEKLRSGINCDVLLSLERVWRCDVYRAGDGVHRAWLERRSEIGGPLRKLTRFFNRKHSAALDLEESLFANRRARRVVANSRMVKDEIVSFYRYPADRIDLVYNGVPLDLFRNEGERATPRDEIVVLFAGSGWERKGLRFAIDAVEAQKRKMKLLVAGRGETGKFSPAR